MMLIDPDDGLTMDQVFDKVWAGLDEPMKSRILAEAEAEGCTWQDVITARIERTLERERIDPALRQARKELVDWENCPCGKDPLLSRQEGGHHAP